MLLIADFNNNFADLLTAMQQKYYFIQPFSLSKHPGFAGKVS